MAHEFPADVVKTTDKFAAELCRFNGLNVDDIARLWRAYTTQSTVVEDAVVSRLENLFWRIWGNVALQQSLTGMTLATLFIAIHENSSLDITQSHSEPAETHNEAPNEAATITTITPRSDEERKESPPKKESKGPLPPILKKSSDGKKSQPPTAPSSYKTTRILVPDKPSRRPTKDATTTPEQARKKPAFVATRTTSRRRGVLIRRKSAQNSPITSPAVERSEENLYEELVTKQEEEEKDGILKTTAENEKADEDETEDARGDQFSWRSLSYLKFDDNNTSPADDTSGPGTSPPPTNFSLSSVHHHRSPEEGPKLTYQQAANSQMESAEPLVDQDFRTNFVQRKRQESAQGTTNNSTASSLTTRLSSTNFRELLNAAEAEAMKNNNSIPQNLPKLDGPVITVTSPRRADKGRNRRPLIIKTPKDARPSKLDTEAVSSVAATAAVSECVTSTSGVFSVPKKSQEVGEQLHSLIRGG